MKDDEKYFRLSFYCLFILIIFIAVAGVMIATEEIGILTYPTPFRYTIGIIIIVTFVGGLVFRGVDIIFERKQKKDQ